MYPRDEPPVFEVNVCWGDTPVVPAAGVLGCEMTVMTDDDAGPRPVALSSSCVVALRAMGVAVPTCAKGEADEDALVKRLMRPNADVPLVAPKKFSSCELDDEAGESKPESGERVPVVDEADDGALQVSPLQPLTHVW